MGMFSVGHYYFISTFLGVQDPFPAATDSNRIITTRQLVQKGTEDLYQKLVEANVELKSHNNIYKCNFIQTCTRLCV